MATTVVITSESIVESSRYHSGTLIGQPSEKESDTIVTHSDENFKPPSSVASRRTQWQKIYRQARTTFQRYWMLLGLAVAIGLAWAFPQVGKTDGSIEAQYTVKWGAVIVIFLLSGLGLEVKTMIHTIMRWRLHLLVQFVSFVLIPFLGYGIVRFFIAVHVKIDEVVCQGWMIALSTSTTVSSNAIMTRNANGNDSAALFNAALGNILGIFISPLLMTFFGDDTVVFPPGSARGSPDYVNILKQLGITVLVPLVVGQALRYFFPKQIKRLATMFHFSIINSLALLCLVWSVFCDGVASDAFAVMSAVDIVAIIGVDILFYLTGCALCIFLCRVPWPNTKYLPEPALVKRWRFNRKDTVAVMYCGATKTVSMGIPLINVLYAGSSQGVVGVLSLPLLMYHITQLFLGNFQVQLLKKWVQKDGDEEESDGTITPSLDNPTASESKKKPSILSRFTTRRRANNSNSNNNDVNASL